MEITPAAIKQIKEAGLEDETFKNIIRIGVKGGGCKGFENVLEFISEKDIDDEEDIKETIDELMFVMDIFSLEYMKGATMDYVRSLRETGFKFTNPLSKSTCGCGSSFSV